MCGVAGIIDYQGRYNGRTAVGSMLRSISYRGPDESGIYVSNAATLGNVRLSIIDLLTGQQPLSDPTGRYWIVHNGEIFNYRELRKNLEADGEKFITQSDTEVIVHLYGLHGPKCLSLLNGQFAFAVWDKQKEELFIARDRVGIRPLFYNLKNGVFSFASEIKALLTQKTVSPKLRVQSLSQIFTFWTTLTPYTAFEDIFELPPGHYLTFSRHGLTITKYWNLDYSRTDKEIKLNEAAGQLEELLKNAVRLRLRADVKVAAYLSGGIDSSATTALIKDIEPGILNTFSIGFDEKDFDESRYQKEAVEYFSTKHRSVSCSSDSIAHLFPKVIWHSETAVTRTAPAPMMILSELVRENNIKVVITGEGSDEILAGYDIFREDAIRRFWASQPASRIRPLLLKKIYPDIPHLRNANPAILKMFFGYRLQETDNPLYSHLLRWNNANHIKKHFSDDTQSALSDYDPLEELAEKLPQNFNTWDPLARAQWLETTVFMSGYLLSSQGDRMAMANSVEGRYPFLDYRVIEFCAGLPSKFKLNGLNEKYLLKKMIDGRIPESIIKRPKQPYRAPISSVFMSKDAPEYVKEMLSGTYTGKAGIFNPDSVASLTEKIEKTGIASEVDNMALTAVISTHLLYHQFIENNNSEYEREELRNLKIVEDK